MSDSSQKPIKRVRAIIIDGGSMLLIKRIKKSGSYWVFPGGQVEVGETHEQALIRECFEEIGVTVEVGEMILHRINDKDGLEGQEEFFHICKIVGGEVGTGTGPEFQPERTQYDGEHRIEWVTLRDIPDLDLRPNDVRDFVYKKCAANTT